MHKIALILIPLILFAILQYLGIGSFQLPFMNENAIDIRDARTGLVISNTGSNTYIAWSDPASKSIRFARNDGLMNTLTSGGMPLTRSISSSGSNVYLAWINDADHPKEISFARSTDGGNNFEIATIAGGSIVDYPVIDSSGPAVYISWIDNSNGNYEVLFASSIDSGKRFSNVVNLSNSKRENSESPSLAASGSNVYVAWHDYLSKFDVFFTSSIDNGKTFREKVKINEGTKNAGFPALDADGSNVYIAWIEGNERVQDILFRMSRDAGKTFEPIINLSKSNARSTLPLIDSDGSLVCVSWLELKKTSTLFTSCSTDGINFNTSSIASANIEYYSLDVDGSNVYVSWVESTDTISKFHLKVSRDSGKGFSDEKIIASGKISEAAVVAKGTNLYAVWDDKKCLDELCSRVDLDIYANISRDMGSNFEKAVKLG